MDTRALVLLGSTGSIGRSTLDVVVAHPGRFDIVALAAHSNVELLAEQCRQFRPRYACIVDEAKELDLRSALEDSSIEILAGKEELVKLASLSDADMIVNAVVGAAGLEASLAAVSSGKQLALANKESLVAGGPLFAGLAEKNQARILPIDSEHSAIWQVLAAGKANEIRRIIITASGGPFRALPAEKFAEITPELALNHPTWKMGPKITIDSSTLANKGLEVIEAVSLFQVPVDKVEVVIHKQSIIHSMVEYVDSAIIAQLSNPDMRLPITYALFWPERVESDWGRMEFDQWLRLDFEPPDFERFPALKMAFEVAARGGTAPAVFNAANEVAVDLFLRKEIAYLDMAGSIRRAIEGVTIVDDPTLEDIMEADRAAREIAGDLQRK